MESLSTSTLNRNPRELGSLYSNFIKVYFHFVKVLQNCWIYIISSANCYGRKSSRNYKRGFTLVEILIALSVFVIIAGIGLFLGMDFYKSYAFRSEKNIIVSAIEKARNQAINNINQTKHGIHFEANPGLKYIIFEGSSYDSANPGNISIESSWNTKVTSPSLPFNIIFDQLSGDCINCQNPNTQITINDGTKSYTISINKEGRIDY